MGQKSLRHAWIASGSPASFAHGDKGFILPLVISVGLIMLVGSAAMLARTFGGLIGSTRLEHSKQAREIAEAGIAKTIEALNRNYNYLLINCYPTDNDCVTTGVWGDTDTVSLPSSVCSDADLEGKPDLTGSTTKPTGDYVIDSYSFSGTQFYGGTGQLRVIGYRKNSDKTKILAATAVDMSFDVKPKPCNCSFGDFSGECSSSGFPGLMASYIDLGNNDVKGATSGNILCTKCTNPNPDGPPTREQAEAAIGALSKSDVDGQIYLGPITLPPVLTFPDGSSEGEPNLAQHVDKSANVNDLPTETSSSKSATYLITANLTATTDTTTTNNNGYCATDTSVPPVTHCRINSIILSGKERLKIDTTDGPVRLYVEGLDANTPGGQVVKVGGSTGIIHEGEPEDLSMFGLPISADPICSSSDSSDTIQTVTLSGTSKGGTQKAANMFVYFPCASVGINGGSGAEAECNTDGECGGGDIQGAVWAKTWDGSNSNNAQLVVPKSMGSKIFIGLGTQYGISVQDYVALGVNSWASFEKL